MHRFLIFAFVLSGCNLVGSRRRIPLRNAAYVYDVIACPDVETEGKFNASMRYFGKGDFGVDVDVRLGDKPIYDPKVIFSLALCPSRALVDCQDYLTFPIEDFCHYITLDNISFAPFFDALKPPMKSCPIMGDYFLRNFSTANVLNNVMDMYKLPPFPDHQVYKFELHLSWKKKLIICFRVTTSFRTA